MDSLFPYLVLDVVTIVAVILVMFRRMTFWHPLTAYLFFHVYSFTYRGMKLASGSVSPLYTGIPNAEVITPDEISRALLWADVGLAVFALAARLAHLQFDAKAERPTVRRVLNPNIAKTLGVLCLPVGLYFFYALKGGYIELEAGGASTGYLQTVALWPIGIIGLLVFTFGFRWYLVFIGLLLFGGVALQGYHRFMLVLPLLFFTAYYLQSRRLRWPTWPILVGAILLGLIFPRLKYIGQAVQNGDNQEAIAQVVESFTFTSKEKGESSSEDFLDQYAGALSLADTNERKFWGSTYLAIITLPIPRAWWPGKPGLADHLQEISTSGRKLCAGRPYHHLPRRILPQLRLRRLLPYPGVDGVCAHRLLPARDAWADATTRALCLPRRLHGARPDLPRRPAVHLRLHHRAQYADALRARAPSRARFRRQIPRPTRRRPARRRGGRGDRSRGGSEARRPRGPELPIVDPLTCGPVGQRDAPLKGRPETGKFASGIILEGDRWRPTGHRPFGFQPFDLWQPAPASRSCNR